MEFLAPFHTQIVHTPIALIIISLLFEIVGRATDSDWWRKAAFAMLVVGVLGAGAAVLSGTEAGERAEERQGVPEAVVDAHEDAGKLALWIGLGAVAARAVSGSVGGARAAVAGLALALHLAAAVAVGIAGYRGGQLVYEHAAGVRLQGQLLRHPGARALAREREPSDRTARAGSETRGRGGKSAGGEPATPHERSRSERPAGRHEKR